MIKFEKVSFEQYWKGYIDAKFRGDEDLSTETDRAEAFRQWQKIKLPKRATTGSAGYDFYAPYGFSVGEGSSGVTVPTGIRWVTDRSDIVLLCFPRSGLGFKYGSRLKNTTGVIDSDYWCSDNGGHIMTKWCADTYFYVKEGEAMMQGVIMPFVKTDDDVSDGIRNGGFGSTTKDASQKTKKILLNEEVTIDAVNSVAQK